MWIRVHKELSSLAVSWIQVLGFALLAILLQQVTDAAAAVVIACWLLCFFIASRLFGIEFDQRTLPRLLAQPISRSRIWCEKMLVGAFLILAGCGAVLAIMWVALSKTEPQGLEGTFHGPLVLIPLIALATGPTVSLWLRDSLRSLWASMALPIAIHLLALMLWIAASGGNQGPHPAVTLVPYCAIMLFVGHRRFESLEIASGGAVSHGRTTGGRLPTAGATTAGRNTAVPEMTRPPRNLISEVVFKELYLQRPSLLMILLAVAAWIGLWLLSFKADLRLASGGTLGDWLEFIRYVPPAVLLLIVPVLIGANAVAVERQLGVTAWQLGLPASRRLLWRLKLAVSVLLTLLSGLLAVALNLPLLAMKLEFGVLQALTLSAMPWPLLALTVGLFGSRHARDPFQALGLSLIFSAGLWYVWGLMQFTATAITTLWPQPLKQLVSIGSLPLCEPVDIGMGLLVLALVWAVPHQEEWISRFRPDRSQCLRVLAAVALLAVVAQVGLLTWTNLKLEYEIIVKDAEIESLDDSHLEWLVREFGLPPERPDIDNLVTIIDLDTYVTLNHSLERDQFQVLRQPVSHPMQLSAWVDGVPWHGVDHWYWLRMRRGLLFSNLAENDPFDPAIHWRGGPNRQRVFSIAPLWFQNQRLARLDRRVRQNVVLEARRASDRLKRRFSDESETLHQAIDQGLRFLLGGPNNKHRPKVDNRPS